MARAPEKVRGLVLVAPAVPTNNPKNSWSRRGGLGRTLRLAATRAVLQVPSKHWIKAPVICPVGAGCELVVIALGSGVLISHLGVAG